VVDTTKYTSPSLKALVSNNSTKLAVLFQDRLDNSLYVSTSEDSGATWNVFTVRSGIDYVANMYNDADDKLHVVYTTYDTTDGKTLVQYSSSDDWGQTWSSEENIGSLSGGESPSDISLIKHNDLVHVVYDNALEANTYDVVGSIEVNTPPVADAGINRSASMTNSTGGKRWISLNGSASYDPDGDPLTYSWTVDIVPSGSTFTSALISNSTSSVARFRADVAGTYWFTLTVTDPDGESHSDQVRINVH